MLLEASRILRRIIITVVIMSAFLFIAILIGLSIGTTEGGSTLLFHRLLNIGTVDPTLNTIIWEIRFPRVMLAALVGATLSVGGLVFQALLRNPLADPYILGISGGSAIGAIIGILMGLSRFPGVAITAFLGSMATLLLLLIMSWGQTIVKRDTLLLSGVMVNAFCAAIIMFLISITQDARLHNIMFWLMGNLALTDGRLIWILTATLFPCFLLIFWFSNAMNLLLLGKEMAQTMGVNIRITMVVLLVATSFMVSSTVAYVGLLGFVGLVIPHLLRLMLGPDHRVLVPACILGGGAFMVLCDVLARTLPEQGEMPAGVITAMIGAPLFIYLLKRSNR
jgi:iron complex transport system permease protein